MNHTCSARALLVGQLPAPVQSCPGPLGSEGSQDGDPRAGMLPQLWIPYGGSGGDPQHREGDAVDTTVLLPKCFPNINRCPYPLRRISVRDVKAEAGKVRHGEGIQVRLPVAPSLVLI